jgi:molybdopterin synthase catalytic subunit
VAQSAPPNPHASLHIEATLHRGPVPIEPLIWPEHCGAEAIFVGRTRVESHAEFGSLLKLEYEVFEPMAMKLMQDLGQHIGSRHGCGAVRIVHALGDIAPGQASVVIQVACPHRTEAFAACRELIDRVKHELPIWKREHWERGTTFVQGCCAHRGPTGEAS